MNSVEVDLMAVVRAMKENHIHAHDCPASHDCERSNCGVYHIPQPCSCWVEATDVVVKS